MKQKKYNKNRLYGHPHPSTIAAIQTTSGTSLTTFIKSKRHHSLSTFIKSKRHHSLTTFIRSKRHHSLTTFIKTSESPVTDGGQCEIYSYMIEWD